MSEGGAAPAENPLNLLLSAPSQPAVQRLFNTAFRYRHTKLSAESPVLSMIAGELGADETQTLKVRGAPGEEEPPPPCPRARPSCLRPFSPRTRARYAR